METLKTLDKKTFYKVADVAQMLLCKTEAEEAEEEQKKKNQPVDQQQAKDPKKKDKQYQWPHGGKWVWYLISLGFIYFFSYPAFKKRSKTAVPENIEEKGIYQFYSYQYIISCHYFSIWTRQN